MAKRRVAVDVYPNRIVERVTMSAANVITFASIRFGTGLFSGVALVIHRLEYTPLSATIGELASRADTLAFGLTNRDDLGSLLPTNLNIIDTNRVEPMMVGAVVSLTLEVLPIIKDFSGLPGGGLIIPTNPLYLAALTAGFAGAAIIDLTMFFTFKQMTDADYIELVQGMLPANI